MASDGGDDELFVSVLDDLGEEVTGIVWPVSLCMAITVALVRLLNPDGSASSSNAVIIASLAYNEDSTDSSSKKFSGAVLNAIIFAGIMAGMTFVLVLLFKYGCFRIIYAYMAFAVFDIFFLITAIVSLQVLQTLNIHVDAISFCFMLFNFAVVGTVGVLFIPIPLLAKQGYMIWTGVITAYIFTWVPEWTSWVLIVVMALYDIAAVLIPGGPLNLLVQVAQERQEMLPALLYEARPARGPYQPNAMRPRPGQGGGDPEAPQSQPSATQAMGQQPARPASAGYQPPLAMQDSLPLPTPHRDGGTTSFLPAIRTSTGAGGGHRPGSPRLAMAAVAPGPLVLGGSAQVVPAPVAGAHEGAGGARPNSGGAKRRGSSPRKDTESQSQEMMPTGASSGTSRFGQAAEAAGVAGKAQRPGSANSQAGQAPQDNAGGSRPLGEGLELLQQPGLGRPAAEGGGLSWHGARRVGGRPVAEGRDVEQGAGGYQPLLSGSQGGTLSAAVATTAAAVAGKDGEAEHPSLGLLQAGGVPPSAAYLRNSQVASGGSGASLGPLGTQGEPLDAHSWHPGAGSSTGARDLQLQAPVPASMLPPVSHHMLPSHGSTAAMVHGVTSAPGNMAVAGDLPMAYGAAAPPPGPGQGGPGQVQPGEVEIQLPDSIKLGLGDFIFYSMLVGRAAMYDYMTVFASYLGIIAGLGITLICLAIYQRALPALPFSIALGVLFYFLTRILLEPFIVPLTASLTYF